MQFRILSKIIMWLLNLPQIYIIKKNQFCLKDGKKYEKGHTLLTGKLQARKSDIYRGDAKPHQYLYCWQCAT